jgi:putative transcriptional regulator
MTVSVPSTLPIDNQIRRLRFEHGEMTQEALARAVGITRQTVIALEAARYAPSLELAMKIAEVFACRVDDVFYRRKDVR